MKVRLSLGSRLFLSHFLAVVAVSGCVGAYFYFSAVNSLLDSLQAQLKNSAALVSQTIDAQTLTGIRSEPDASLPAYSQVLEKLRRLRRANPDIAFLYIMRLEGGRVFFVVDSDESDQQALPGHECRSVPPALLEGFSGPSVDRRISEAERGAFLSGYAPLPNGKGEYMLGIDMKAPEVWSKLRRIRVAGLFALTFSILLPLLFSRLLSSRILLPIRLLIDRCNAIAGGRIEEPLPVLTGDELGQLTEAFNTMSVHLGESQEKNRKTETALKQSRNDLETRVAERTRELRELNEKLLHEIVERKKAEEALALAARTDTLTGTLNRRALLEHLDHQVAQFERNRIPFAVLLCDVDHFKPINDTFGHGVGDEVLRTVAARLSEAVRKQDLVARWGGEEFLMMLPNTDLRGGLQVAEKMRSLVNNEVFRAGGKDLKLTLSIGVSVFSQGRTVEDCIKEADKALYRAKHMGRNRVVAASQVSRPASRPELTR